MTAIQALVKRMDSTYYLDIFQKAADQLDQKLLNKKQVEVAAGIYLESVFLKLYKIAWANKSLEPLSSPSRIFFSAWINDKAIKESKILYNIHAVKLRQLNGYSITSREFAAAFRRKFKDYKNHWPNAGIDFGPQTLMQGWKKVDAGSVQDDIVELANQFLEIDHLVDDLLDEYKSSIAKKKKDT